MLSLTTAQRELLHRLLAIEAPTSAAVFGQQLHLSARQVHYSLRFIKDWLERRNARLQHTPGIGIQIICTPEQRRKLVSELISQSHFQLILTPEQRQQLLALALLVAQQPRTLHQLQHDLAIARATVLKDLDVVEAWLQTFDLRVERRQHRGCWIVGSELAKRQVLAAIVWGNVPFERPVLSVRADTGIVFAFAQDHALLSIIGPLNTLVRAWSLGGTEHVITQVEAALGARFTDEAVLALMVGVALQTQRIAAEQHVVWDAKTLVWLQSQRVWAVAAQVGAQLWPQLLDAARNAEVAAFALQLLGSDRDESWSNDVANVMFHGLITTLLKRVAAAYAVPLLAADQLLCDGLEVLILPAYVRQRFGLWTPPKPMTDTYTERYAVERAVARQLNADIAAATGFALPPAALDDLTLLLRAAIVRAKPERARQVLVVCPSGMATTQLLLARLKARFPRLGTFEVLPMRALTAERLAEADLIVTTVPLVLPERLRIDVIQVHPMLKPEDVAALTQWMM